MSQIESNLVGAVAEVRVGDINAVVDGKVLAKVMARGEIRAVGMLETGNLVVWIETLDAAESACWFGDAAPDMVVDNPGQVVQMVLGVMSAPRATGSGSTASVPSQQLWTLHVVRNQARKSP